VAKGCEIFSAAGVNALSGNVCAIKSALCSFNTKLWSAAHQSGKYIDEADDLTPQLL